MRELSPGDHWHYGPCEALVARFDANPARGLEDKDASDRLTKEGANELPTPQGASMLKRFFSQFTNPIVLTLLVAAVVATVNGASNKNETWLARFGDAIAIGLIVVLNAVLGFYQERRAEEALEALKRMQTPTARVRRGDVVKVIPARELVVGDILEIEAGDAVPADARLIQTIHLATQEASLTGESLPVNKDAVAELPEDAPIGDRATMLFTGTSIIRGKGRALVVATGVKTELGKLSAMLSAPNETKTPLEEKLDHFGKRVLWGCLAVSAVLFGYGLYRGEHTWHELLLEAVSLAVAAIPEGLPAITTITLALGMQRMAKRGAIIRKLAAVETLGAATVICTDKTGTLTQNEMTVREVYCAGITYSVTGIGYDPKGDIVDHEKNPVDAVHIEPLKHLLETMALANTADLARKDDKWVVVGDPTEGALLTLAAKGGIPKESVAPSHQVVRELPFDSDRKRMTVVTLDAEGKEVAHTKGSADVLIPRCVAQHGKDGIEPLDDDKKHAILMEAERMGGLSLRVLAVCRRELRDASRASTPPGSGGEPSTDIEQRLTFIGLVGMIDPPREGVKEAVRACAEAHVKAVMITGDHKVTAVAIAKELGLWSDDAIALTGSELEKLTDEALARRIDNARVFARVTAEQKLRIVRAFKARGHIVAMTGDGVNDAPALREAHIGIAMGMSGTDVAREAADMILADDNFATIVHAVREGRAIWRNIQKFIFFLLSSNAGLLVIVFIAALMPSLLDLRPLMILWINLVTNGLPALALGIDPPDPTQMNEKPRMASSGLLSARDWLGILGVGVIMGAAALACYMWPWDVADGERPAFARAAAFTLLALSPLFHAFNCRSATNSMFQAKPLFPAALLIAIVVSALIHLVAVLVPSLRGVFATFPLSSNQWFIVIALSRCDHSRGGAAQARAARGGGRQRSRSDVSSGVNMKRAVCMLVVAACGGAPAAPSKTPDSGKATTSKPADDGMGKLAAAQGGLAMLGGNGNREDGGSTGIEAALGGTLRADDVDPKHAPRLDGVLGEWPERVTAGETLSGKSDAIGFATGVQVDNDKIWIAGDVTSASVDHASLVIAFPSARGSLEAFEIGFWPGKPGSSSGSVKWKSGASKGKEVSGAKIVEAPRKGGVTFEATIPWATFPAASTTRVGLRAALRYHDATGVIATSKGEVDKPSELAPLPTSSELAVVDGLLTQKGLAGTAPKIDVYADVAGDERKERISVFGRFFVICGPGYRGGKQFFWREVQGDMATLETRDLEGRGKDDLIVRRRVANGDIAHEILEVWSIPGKSEPITIFSHEIAVADGKRKISNGVRLAPKEIEVSSESATGWDASTFKENSPEGSDALLLPWGNVKSRTFKLEKGKFVVAAEVPRTGTGTATGTGTGTGTAPDPKKGSDLGAAVLSAYLSDGGKEAGTKPRFDLEVSVDGDARAERVLLFGREIVVLGPGFKDGKGWAKLTMSQFAADKDVTEMTARDLTGDGAAEIVVRGVRHVSQASGGDVESDCLFVYQVKSGTIARVFAIETARASGKNRLEGRVTIGSKAIDVAPGNATGWTKESYPWPEEKPGGSIEPLLLPWGSAKSRQYKWNGSAFAP